MEAQPTATSRPAIAPFPSAIAEAPEKEVDSDEEGQSHSSQLRPLLRCVHLRS